MQVTLELGVIATIVSIIVSAAVSLRVAKKQRMIEIITSNRVKWMQEVKELFGEYFLYTQYYSKKKLAKDNSEFIKKINEISNNIKLQLNLQGAKDQQIIKLINELNLAHEKMVFTNPNNSKKKLDELLTNEIVENYIKKYKKNNDTYKNYREDILKKIVIKDVYSSLSKVMNQKELIEIYVQIYLKCEWERVKVEAREGINAKYDFDKNFEKIENDMKKEIDEIKKKIINYKEL